MMVRSCRKMQRETVVGEGESLIPGLPDEIATLCILRVPADSLSSCSKVSKGWKSILARNECISTLRKKLGFRDPWLVVSFHHRRANKIQVKAFNLAILLWHTLLEIEGSFPKPLGDDYREKGYNCCCFRSSTSIPQKGVVYFFHTTANLFLKYEAREDCWTKFTTADGGSGKKLNSARAVDGKVYLINDGQVISALDSEKGKKWEDLPVCCCYVDERMTVVDREGEDDAVVFDGRLLFMGGIYDPTSGVKLESMPPRLRRGLRVGFAVEIGGHLFVLGKHDKSYVGLKVYDAERDGWDVVEGDDLPDAVHWRGKFCCCLGNKIYSAFYSVIVGTISRDECTGMFRVGWEIIYQPPTALSSTATISAQVLIA